MATTWTSGRFAGALTVVGALTAGVVTITTLTLTTGNITTANITTANVQTLSGATINALQANGVVKARTLSGAALNLGGAGLAKNKLLCVKSTGAIGVYTRTATGTLTESTCQ